MTHCKHKGCCKYVFTVKEIVDPSTPAPILVERIGMYKHRKDEVKKRHIMGESRPQIYEELRKQTVNGYQSFQFATMSQNFERGGNISGPQKK